MGEFFEIVDLVGLGKVWTAAVLMESVVCFGGPGFGDPEAMLNRFGWLSAFEYDSHNGFQLAEKVILDSFPIPIIPWSAP